MTLTEELRSQFESKYRDIISTEFNDNITVEDSDIADCFRSVLLDETDTEVESAIEESMKEWISENKASESPEMLEEMIDDLDDEIVALQNRRETLSQQLESLEDRPTKVVSSWDALPQERTHRIKEVIPDRW